MLTKTKEEPTDMATLHKQSMIVKTFQPEALHHIGDSPKDSAFSDRMIYATHISSSAIVSLIGGRKNCGSSHQLPSYRSSSGVSTLRCQNNVAIKTDSKVNCNRLLDG